jgi:hypothetical protein
VPAFLPGPQQISNEIFSPAKYELIFNADVDPIGFKTYLVSKSGEL